MGYSSREAKRLLSEPGMEYVARAGVMMSAYNRTISDAVSVNFANAKEGTDMSNVLSIIGVSPEAATYMADRKKMEAEIRRRSGE